MNLVLQEVNESAPIPKKVSKLDKTVEVTILTLKEQENVNCILNSIDFDRIIKCIFLCDYFKYLQSNLLKATTESARKGGCMVEIDAFEMS